MLREIKIMSICICLILIATLSLAADFGTKSATLTHRYFPMELGDKLVYRSYGLSFVIEIALDAIAVEVIDSVECLKIYASPDTYYWMEEGSAGDIWLLKEFDSEFNETTFYGKKKCGTNYPQKSFGWSNSLAGRT